MTEPRLATPADVPEIRTLERAAGEVFRSVGLARIADHEPPHSQVLCDAARAGELWVMDVDKQLAAWAWFVLRDDALHIAQVSAHPRQRGQRYGTRLIEHASEVAAGRGIELVTLTTYTEVPWNAPWYRTLGFAEFAPQELPAFLAEIREQELHAGLDIAPRCAMYKKVKKL